MDHTLELKSICYHLHFFAIWRYLGTLFPHFIRVSDQLKQKTPPYESLRMGLMSCL
jgi:hypothetical protein